MSEVIAHFEGGPLDYKVSILPHGDTRVAAAHFPAAERIIRPISEIVPSSAMGTKVFYVPRRGFGSGVGNRWIYVLE